MAESQSYVYFEEPSPILHPKKGPIYHKGQCGDTELTFQQGDLFFVEFRGIFCSVTSYQFLWNSYSLILVVFCSHAE